MIQRLCTCLGICIALITTSCTKEKITKVDSKLLIDALSIGVGSHYVYVDSVTGSIDSFWVTDQRKTSYVFHYDDPNEIYYYEMVNKDNKQLKFYTIGDRRMMRVNVNSFALVTMLDPFELGFSYKSNLESYTAVSYKEYEAINGTDFYKIYSIAGSVTTDDDTLNYLSEYAASGGLLRLKVTKNDTVIQNLNLIRANIIK